jgi:hypothetical protein
LYTDILGKSKGKAKRRGFLSQIVYLFVYLGGMKLNDYFRAQKDFHISDTQKLDVYQDFLCKQMKGKYSRKRSLLHVKSFAYSLVILFMLFGFYGVYFMSDRYTEYEWLVMNSDNTVWASYIAKIVDFNGSFYIEHNGKRVQTSTIQDSDIVTLKENTQLVFNINVSTKAKLIWPAQFSIQKISGGVVPQYKLNIMQGDFVELKSTQDTISEKVQLNMADKMLVQQANGKPIDYQLFIDGDRHIVKNNGGSLLVTTIDENDKETRTSINRQQVLAVQNNDISVYENLQKFVAAVKTKDISQTFTFNAYQESLTTSSLESGAEETTISEVALPTLLESTDETVDQNISLQTSPLFSDTQRVITPSQNDALRWSLNKEFLLWDIQEVYVDILAWDDKSLAASYKNLESRIQKLYSEFGLKYAGSTSASIKEKLLSLKQSVSTFSETTNPSYLIPPKYFDTLKVLNNRLSYLSNQSYGSNAETADQSRQNLVKVLPKNLSF